jgi:AhpD family alkylhydroperoxidase
MSTHAQDYYQQNATAMKPVRASMPDLIKGFGSLHQSAMKAGALTVLEKELTALAVGLALRCENCIYAHVQAALGAGATRQQILEAAAVAVMMQGGPAYTYLPRVTEALEALGHGGD